MSRRNLSLCCCTLTLIAMQVDQTITPVGCMVIAMIAKVAIDQKVLSNRRSVFFFLLCF